MKAKEPKVQGTKVVFGPVRLSYPHLLKRHSFNEGEDGKYSSIMLIPKDEKPTIRAIKEGIEAAKQQGLVSKWGGKEPKYLDLPVFDGDKQLDKRGNEKENPDENLFGHYWVRTKSNSKPAVIDRQKEPINDEEEVYGGMWAMVSVTFFPYAANGNTGIGCALNSVMKWADGERFGGYTNAAADFDGFNLSEDEDEDL